jgi:hypothetical protein
VAFSLRPARPAFRAGALKRSTAQLTNLAPRFVTERAKPGIEQSCRGITIFIGTRSIGLIPVPGDTPLGLGIPEMSEGSPSVRWFGFGVCAQITRLVHLRRNGFAFSRGLSDSLKINFSLVQ